MTRREWEEPCPASSQPSAHRQQVECDRCHKAVLVKARDLPMDWGAVVEGARIAHYCGPCMDARATPRFKERDDPLAAYFSRAPAPTPPRRSRWRV